MITDSQCAIGNGFIDWKSILYETKKNPTKILEHDDPKDYKDYVSKSFKFLNNNKMNSYYPVNISEIYFKCQNIYNNFEIVACTDIKLEAAKKMQKIFNLKFQSVENLLSNNEIDLIINLTIPSAHKEITINYLKAGKHCFIDKIAMNFAEGNEIQEISKQKNL